MKLSKPEARKQATERIQESPLPAGFRMRLLQIVAKSDDPVASAIDAITNFQDRMTVTDAEFEAASALCSELFRLGQKP